MPLGRDLNLIQINPAPTNKSPMTVVEQADVYQRDYTFMALNAVMMGASAMQRIHAADMVDSLKLVFDELQRRGVTSVPDEVTFKAKVAELGMPPAPEGKVKL